MGGGGGQGSSGVIQAPQLQAGYLCLEQFFVHAGHVGVRQQLAKLWKPGELHGCKIKNCFSLQFSVFQEVMLCLLNTLTCLSGPTYLDPAG